MLIRKNNLVVKAHCLNSKVQSTHVTNCSSLKNYELDTKEKKRKIKIRETGT